jgi:mono/diheme cytochrome c family protein
MSGVYTAEQAARGMETYNSICLSCHSLAEQSGTNFSKKWVGFPLWDLFDYLSVNMPQSDPGTLTPKEYAQVVAYMLKFNGMPAGKEEVPTDTVSLKKIKVDTLPVDTLQRRSAELVRRLLRNR